MRVTRLIVLGLLITGCTAPTPPLPHLYVRASGEDLGPSISGTIAQNDRYGGAIDFVHSVAALMETADLGCATGNGVIDLDGRSMEDRFILPSGVLVQPVKPRNVVLFDATAIWARVDDSTIVCASFSPMQIHGEYFQWITDTHGEPVVVPRYRDGELEIR